MFSLHDLRIAAGCWVMRSDAERRLSMDTENTGEFPRREFTASKVPYRLCAYAASLILPLIIVASVGKLVPDFPARHAVGLIAWCLLAVGCIIVLWRMLSGMDFEKPVAILDTDSVTFLQPRAKMLLWSTISEMRFRESGHYRTVKMFVFELENGSELEFQSSWMTGVSARQLFELIKMYHRKFGPPVPVVPGYDSSGWTGE